MLIPDPTAQLREEFDEQLRAATDGGQRPAAPRSLPRPQRQDRHRLLKDLATAPADERRERGAPRQRAQTLCRATARRGRRVVTRPLRAPWRRGPHRRHAAGPRAAARPPPSAHDRPRPTRRDLHAHGVRGRRRSGSRRRVALLRCAEHAGGASRARHAGHAVPGVAAAGDSPAERRGRCCARIPRRCRSATCRRTSRRFASSCPAASIGATIST